MNNRYNINIILMHTMRIASWQNGKEYCMLHIAHIAKYIGENVSYCSLFGDVARRVLVFRSKALVCHQGSLHALPVELGLASAGLAGRAVAPLTISASHILRSVLLTTCTPPQVAGDMCVMTHQESIDTKQRMQNGHTIGGDAKKVRAFMDH